jgi:hypothetical protein
MFMYIYDVAQTKILGLKFSDITKKYRKEYK